MFRKEGKLMVDLKIGDIVTVIIDNEFRQGIIYEIDDAGDFYEEGTVRVADKEDLMQADFSVWVNYDSIVKINERTDSTIMSLYKYKQYQQYRNSLDNFYQSKNWLNTKIITLTSMFTLEIKYYQTSKYLPNITKGILHNGNGNKIEIRRNYADFPYLFMEHINGNPYLICGEEYQGFTIINCLSFTKITHLSDKCYVRKGFSPYVWHYNDIDNLLYVDGCDYWGKEEHFMYHFKNPELKKLRKSRLGRGVI
jgi:hypothetical protein